MQPARESFAEAVSVTQLTLLVMFSRLAGRAANGAAARHMLCSVRPMLVQTRRLAEDAYRYPREHMVTLCNAVNEGDKTMVKELAGRLLDDTFLQTVIDDDGIIFATVEDHPLDDDDSKDSLDHEMLQSDLDHDNEIKKLKEEFDDDFSEYAYLGSTAMVSTCGYGKEEVEQLLDVWKDNLDGWTNGQKLTNEQWQKVHAALFDIVDEGAAKAGAQAFYDAFDEDWEELMMPVIEEVLLESKE